MRLETCHLISCSISRVKLHSSSSSSSSGDIPKVRAPLNLNICRYNCPPTHSSRVGERSLPWNLPPLLREREIVVNIRFRV
jgi:hypothetical protein